MQHIQNGRPVQQDVLEYQYRKTFNMSAIQYADEPIDSVHIGLFIHSEAEKQRKRIEQNG